MANDKNLIPITSKKVARELGSKGGKAKAKAHKERKLLTAALKDLLAKGETIQNINTALLDKAESGDTKAYEIIRDSIGEKPTDVKEILGVIGVADASDEAFAEMMLRSKK